MVQWIKALVGKPGNVSAIPQPNMAEGKTRVLKVVLWRPHTCHGKHVHLHTIE